MHSRIAAVIFDLDGTLVDSAISIAAALNRMRARRGAAASLAVNDVKHWVSLGAGALVRNALAETVRDVDSDLAEFRAEYAGIETPAECLYDGIPETLDALAAAGLMLAVCSNKPQHLCVKVLRETGILKHFRTVVGGDAVTQPKPHPSHLLATINALGASPSKSVYVGDSSIDLLASQAAGVRFLLAKYGYADPALLNMNSAPLEILESLRDLPALLALKS